MMYSVMSKTVVGLKPTGQKPTPDKTASVENHT